MLLFVVLLALVAAAAARHREAGPLWQLRTSTSSRRAAGAWPAGTCCSWRVAVVVLFPVYTTVIGALKPGDEVLQHPLVPGPFTLDGFSEAWTEGHLDRYLLNSFVVASVITIAQLVTSLLSAYAFAMIDFPGRGLLFVVFLATLLVPLETTLVVNRRTVDSLGWLNTYQGLAVPFLATAFGTFLMRQVFIGLPADLRDAAAIDGVGHLGFLRHVGIPLVRPTLGALALFSFLVELEPVPVAEPDHHRGRHEHGAERAAPVAVVRPRRAEPADGRHDHRRHPDRRSCCSCSSANSSAASRRGRSRDEARQRCRRLC